MQLLESEKIDFLLKHISYLHDAHAVDAFIEGLFALEGVKVVGFINAHAVNLCIETEKFMQAISACDYVLRDGVGLELLAVASRRAPGLNMNGTDFIPHLIREAVSKSVCVHVIGTEAPFNLRAANVIRGWGALVGSVDHGFHAVEDYLEILRPNLHEKNLIILGMGMPKQEFVAAALKESLGDVSAIIVNGGAILDFMSGRVRRAPVWIRRLRFEWFYRLAVEPRRMWRRYVLGNIIFLWRGIRYFLWRVFP